MILLPLAVPWCTHTSTLGSVLLLLLLLFFTTTKPLLLLPSDLLSAAAAPAAVTAPAAAAGLPRSTSQTSLVLCNHSPMGFTVQDTLLSPAPLALDIVDSSVGEGEEAGRCAGRGLCDAVGGLASSLGHSTMCDTVRARAGMSVCSTGSQVGSVSV